MAVVDVIFGAKPVSKNCHVGNSSADDTCCQHETNDCVVEFQQTNVHKNCSGKVECTGTVIDRMAINADTCGDTSTASYDNWTNYAYMNYYCIERK